MSAPAIRGAFAHKLPSAVSFRAWRLADGSTVALPIKLDADTLEEAVAAALVHGCFHHKDTLLIRRVDEGRGEATLHSYAIKRKSQARYARGPDGCSRAVHDLYPTLLFALAVEAFEPVRPFDALRDDPVGRDLTLVEG